MKIVFDTDEHTSVRSLLCAVEIAMGKCKDAEKTVRAKLAEQGWREEDSATRANIKYGRYKLLT